MCIADKSIGRLSPPRRLLQAPLDVTATTLFSARVYRSIALTVPLCLAHLPRFARGFADYIAATFLVGHAGGMASDGDGSWSFGRHDAESFRMIGIPPPICDDFYRVLFNFAGIAIGVILCDSPPRIQASRPPDDLPRRHRESILLTASGFFRYSRWQADMLSSSRR